MSAELTGRIRAAIEEQVGSLGVDPPPPITLEVPPKPEFGDLACPVAFELARRLKKAPREIAAALKGRIEGIEGVSRVELAGGGYLNVYFDRDRFLRGLARELGAPLPAVGRRQADRRAHQHQPEQGRPYRAPAQRGPGRLARSLPAVPGRAGRGAELHRRHGGPGRRPRRRVPGHPRPPARNGPRPRGPVRPRRGVVRADRPASRLRPRGRAGPSRCTSAGADRSTITAGSSTPRSRPSTPLPPRTRRGAKPRSRRWRRGGAPTPSSRPSCRAGWCFTTSGRWSGSTSGTTCFPGRATSSPCTSGRPPSPA